MPLFEKACFRVQGNAICPRPLAQPGKQAAAVNHPRFPKASIQYIPALNIHATPFPLQKNNSDSRKESQQ
ncbi:MAG: hypothetical protein ACK5L3_15275 [Oscillospiraceae bacterium]